MYLRPVKRKINIAIDGYSACGKSTLAKAMAKSLGYAYIDSGAMYRAVTLFALQNNLIKNGEVNVALLENVLDDIKIDFINKNGSNTTILNGKDVEEDIRKMEVSSMVSQVSRIKKVRIKLRHLQQETARNGGVVMDGRDIGSAVLPFAELKIFMTADMEIRTLRRYEELLKKGEEISIEEVRKNLEKRDLMDTTRKENPLVQVSDAILLDNTHLSESEQLQKAMEWAQKLILQTG